VTIDVIARLGILEDYVKAVSLSQNFIGLTYNLKA
jgi:hypothetical protein